MSPWTMMDANILRSPRQAAASLSPAELKKSPYPPDFLPGARDVNSPYGMIQLYEWGPEEGKKVLFIHGLSTPAPALGTVAETMAQRGCRVMILDLWGRGYSDTPSDLKHDSRLYTTQILLAISTSPISWTGLTSGGFSLVGYSMGGGLVVSFAGYFPQLVNSIVLIAPGGLYKSLPPKYHALSVRYPWLFPSTYVKWMVRKLLNGPTEAVCQDGGSGIAGFNLRNGSEVSSTTQTSLVDVPPKNPIIDVTGIVDWEIDNNEGFVYSVISSIRYAPIENQYPAWRHLRSLLEDKKMSGTISDLPNRLFRTKILLLVGEKDSILPKDQLCRNAESTLGAENLQIIGFDGGHGFPITQGAEVAESICKFWEL